MPEGCWLVQIPNTSEWQMVCTTNVGVPTVVPTLSWVGMAVLAVCIVVVAWRRL